MGAPSAALASLPVGLVWQGNQLAAASRPAHPTGFAELDAELPGGGWPGGALTELIATTPGIGELSLLLPLMRRTGAQQWLAFIAPPLLPYAPALHAAGVPLERVLLVRNGDAAQTQWAIRQACSSGACSAVLAWPAQTDNASLRRLQLAAEASATPLFLFRPPAAAAQASPAVLRLQLSAAPGGVSIHILKRRGPAASAALHLRLPARTDTTAPPHAVACPAPARSAPAGIYPRCA